MRKRCYWQGLIGLIMLASWASCTEESAVAPAQAPRALEVEARAEWTVAETPASASVISNPTTIVPQTAFAAPEIALSRDGSYALMWGAPGMQVARLWSIKAGLWLNEIQLPPSTSLVRPLASGDAVVVDAGGTARLSSPRKVQPAFELPAPPCAPRDVMEDEHGTLFTVGETCAGRWRGDVWEGISFSGAGALLAWDAQQHALALLFRLEQGGYALLELAPDPEPPAGSETRAGQASAPVSGAGHGAGPAPAGREPVDPAREPSRSLEGHRLTVPAPTQAGGENQVGVQWTTIGDIAWRVTHLPLDASAVGTQPTRLQHLKLGDRSRIYVQDGQGRLFRLEPGDSSLRMLDVNLPEPFSVVIPNPSRDSYIAQSAKGELVGGVLSSGAVRWRGALPPTRDVSPIELRLEARAGSVLHFRGAQPVFADEARWQRLPELPSIELMEPEILLWDTHGQQLVVGWIGGAAAVGRPRLISFWRPGTEAAPVFVEVSCSEGPAGRTMSAPLRMALSPGGRHVVASTGDCVNLFSLTKRTRVMRLGGLKTLNVGFGADEESLYLATAEGSVFRRELLDQSEGQTVLRYPLGIRAAVFQPESDRALIAGNTASGDVRVELVSLERQQVLGFQLLKRDVQELALDEAGENGFFLSAGGIVDHWVWAPNRRSAVSTGGVRSVLPAGGSKAWLGGNALVQAGGPRSRRDMVGPWSFEPRSTILALSRLGNSSCLALANAGREVLGLDAKGTVQLRFMSTSPASWVFIGPGHSAVGPGVDQWLAGVNARGQSGKLRASDGAAFRRALAGYLSSCMRAGGSVSQ